MCIECPTLNFVSYYFSVLKKKKAMSFHSFLYNSKDPSFIFSLTENICIKICRLESDLLFSYNNVAKILRGWEPETLGVGFSGSCPSSALVFWSKSTPKM